MRKRILLLPTLYYLENGHVGQTTGENRKISQVICKNEESAIIAQGRAVHLFSENQLQCLIAADDIQRSTLCLKNSINLAIEVDADLCWQKS